MISALDERAVSIAAGLRGNLLHPYNRRHRVSAVARYLEWQVRHRLGRPWTRRFWRDRDVTLFPDSSESKWLLYNVIMDWPEFPFLEAYLRPDDTVVDVGANIGIYTLWISRFLDERGQLIAFEPSSESFRRLSRQVAQNALARVVLERKAVAQASGRLMLTTGMDMENRVVDAAAPATATATEAVEAVTLDDYLRAHAITVVHFLKVDVEGAEPLVLDGADATLRARRIAVMQLEVGDHWRRYGRDVASTTERLRQYGYTPFVPNDEGRRVAAAGDWSAAVRGQNLLLTRSLAEVEARLAAGVAAAHS